jgi:hypothetical protein
LYSTTYGNSINRTSLRFWRGTRMNGMRARTIILLVFVQVPVRLQVKCVHRDSTTISKSFRILLIRIANASMNYCHRRCRGGSKSCLGKSCLSTSQPLEGICVNARTTSDMKVELTSVSSNGKATYFRTHRKTLVLSKDSRE